MSRCAILFALIAVAFGQQRDSGCGSDHFQLGYDGTFSSMNYDPVDPNARYDPNSFCDWVIETSAVGQQVIQIDFTDFAVEGAVNCVYDSVTAYDGTDDTFPILRKMCGHSIPNPTVSSSNYMTVHFRSDASVQYGGFNLIWSTRDQPIDCGEQTEYLCGDDVNGYCIPISQRCDGNPDCPTGEDEQDCPSNSAECGLPTIQPNLTEPYLPNYSVKVVDGWEAVPGSWPYVAAIQRMYSHACGATIVASRWLITAAHCVFLDRVNPGVFDVITGNHYYYQPDPYEAVHDVEAIHIHPGFSFFKEDYNIAMLKTKLNMSLINDYTQDICLPAQGTIFANNTETWIAGWGDTIPPNSKDAGIDETSVLMQAKVNMYSDAHCNSASLYNGSMFEPSMLCAGHETHNVDACNGDDGGPMMWYDPIALRWTLSGVVSIRTGDKCAQPGLPGLYTDVASVMEWIEDTMLYN